MLATRTRNALGCVISASTLGRSRTMILSQSTDLPLGALCTHSIIYPPGTLRFNNQQKRFVGYIWGQKKLFYYGFSQLDGILYTRHGG
jgi:hypothetical protein